MALEAYLECKDTIQNDMLHLVSSQRSCPYTGKPKKKGNMNMFKPSRCYLCRQKAKIINHLFLHYNVTSQRWDLFINLKGIRWALS
ncbi:hypothetical protein H5410_057662 [Solanum commersonii]|uniref:Uncharacterized protein n=1 Tax=Solanum commersonii TaxID=4109 RepID=A0A9J5WR89_SOLCO|nr:hypothetical protein H5410_057662 [Solanum commersonii]